MPFLETAETIPSFVGGADQPGLADQRRVTFGETVAAGFRQENDVMAVASLFNRPSYEPDPDFNVVQRIRGSHYERDHLDTFLTVRSEAEMLDVMGRIDQEMRDRRTLEDAGGWGVAAGIAGGLISPTTFLPVGGMVRSINGGWSMAKSAATVGVSAGLQAGVSELALQAAQETRTGMESAISIGSATILGGVIGWGAAGLLTRAEFKRLEKLFDSDRTTLSAELEGVDLSAGAAQADTRTGKLVSWGIDKVPVLGDIHKRLSPNTRVLTSDNLAARRAYNDLVEHGMRTEDNLNGVPTSFNGPPVSRLVRDTQTAITLHTDGILTRGFAEYRGYDSAGSMMKGNAADLLGRTPDSVLTQTQFNEQVTLALFSGDVHPVPAVQNVAKALRDEVLEPLRAKLVEAKMLDDGITPGGDPSWFFRMYDTDALVRQRPDAVRRIGDWLESEQGRKAGAQERLTRHATVLDDLDATRTEIDAMERRLSDRVERAKGALAERGMDVGRVAADAERATGKVEAAAAQRADIEAVIAELRGSSIPALRAEARELEAQYARYARLEEKAKVSEADLDRIEKEIFEDAFPKGSILRNGIEMAMGDRKVPKAPSLLKWVADEGGIYDPRMKGEMDKLKESKIPGLIRKGDEALPGMLGGGFGKRRITFDDLGLRFQSLMAETLGDVPRPTQSEVIDILTEAAAGRPPYWWTARFESRPDIEAASVAEWIGETVGHDGSAVTRRAVIDELAGMKPGGMADLGDTGIAPGPLREMTGEKLAALRRELSAAKTKLRTFETDRMGTVARREGAAGEMDRATGQAVNRTTKRMATLEARQAANDAKAALIKMTRDALDRAEADELAKIEAELMEWGGKSANEAVSSIKARERASVDRDPSLPRLKSADDAVRRAASRILDSDRTLTREELESRANEIIDRIIGTPDGRLPYDAASGGPRVGAVGERAEMGDLRGALRSRDFMIPTALISDFIIKDPRHIMGAISRTLVPDLELVRRFGDVDMKAKIKEIEGDASNRALAAATDAERTAIDNESKAVIRDIAAQRDRIKGVYGWSPNGRNMARFAAMASRVGNVQSLGGSTMNSMPDMAGVVYRYGLESVFRAGWEPFFKGLIGQSEARGIIKQQAQAAMVAIDTHNAMRANALADIIDNNRPGNKFERSMHWLSDRFQVINLQAPWTDLTKSIASGVIVDGLLAMSERVAKNGATKRDIAALAESGIDAGMAARIWKQFEDGGGAVVERIRLPNTADWTDVQARKVFETALRREADIAVITPGLEKPLVMSNPIGALLLQFKSFVAGANERLLIANLQRADINTLQGLFASVALGMLSYKLYSMATGAPTSDRPQDWIKEGISRSGVLGWFDDINSITAKFTQGRGDIYRLIGADKPLSRMQGRGTASALLGPTVGQLEKLSQVTGAASSGEWTGSDTRAVRRMLPLQNLFYLRRLLDEAERGFNDRMGIQQLPEPAR